LEDWLVLLQRRLYWDKKIVLVRAEELVISGPFMRNKLKYLDFLKKHVNTNPKRGPFHYRAPSKIMWRAIRGMLPHKTPRGDAALQRVKIFEGIPSPYDKIKRAVVPRALKVVQLRPGRKVTHLGRLSSEVGWKHGETVKKLEERRKIKAQAFYQRKQALLKLRAKAAQQ